MKRITYAYRNEDAESRKEGGHSLQTTQSEDEDNLYYESMESDEELKDFIVPNDFVEMDSDYERHRVRRKKVKRKKRRIVDSDDSEEESTHADFSSVKHTSDDADIFYWRCWPVKGQH